MIDFVQAAGMFDRWYRREDRPGPEKIMNRGYRECKKQE
jgi:hypothetical protein